MDKELRRGVIGRGRSLLLVGGSMFLVGVFFLCWNCGPVRSGASTDPDAETAAAQNPVSLGGGQASGSDMGNRTKTAATASNMLPADRLYDWDSSCGIPGGIPSRSKIYRTMTPANTLADINSAIQVCPSGQVVFLAAGTYNVGQITFGSKSGVTLRGAGPGKTVIYTSVTTGAIVNLTNSVNENQGIAVASGYMKGSKTIILASAPNAYFRVGGEIIISEDASPNKWGTGIGVYYVTDLTGGQAIYGLDQHRIFHHTNRIVSIKEKTITIAAQIPLDFSASLNVKAYAPWRPWDNTTLCGVEDLTVDGHTICDAAIYFSHADRCWLKNVEVKNCFGGLGLVKLDSSFQCEIRRTYIHDCTSYPSNGEGYGIGLLYGSSNCLIVDTIHDRTSSICIAEGTSANAYLYNYAHDLLRANYYSRGVTINHGPHCYMQLYEGNILSSLVADGYHGSDSHSLILRNNVNGDISTRIPPDPIKLLNLCRGSYYNTVVGNILGSPKWTPTYYDQVVGGQALSIYSVGLPTADNNTCSTYTEVPWANWTKPINQPDADVAGTLIRHGNYDYFNRAVIWDSNIVSHTIPDSLFYTSKPDFFGSLQWPPIGPDVSGLVTANPAKARWDAYSVSGNLADLFRDQ